MDYSFLVEKHPRAVEKMAQTIEPQLTDDERRLIADYTGGGYNNINKFLRGEKVKAGPNGAKKLSSAIEIITNAIRKHRLPQEIRVFRIGIDAELGGKKQLVRLVKKRVTLKAFMSTSTDKWVCDPFIRDGFTNIFWSIKVPNGMRVMPLLDTVSMEPEDEVLFAPGAQFIIEDVYRASSAERYEYIIKAKCVKDGF